jgi:hypothetical protein
MHSSTSSLTWCHTFPPERTFPFHAGQQITMAGGWGNLIGELLAHGDDIAGATGRPFAIPSQDTEILWRFAAPVLQGWLRPETARVTDTWQLNFPFGPIAVRFHGGQLHWNVNIPTDAEYVLDIDDAAKFALVFPYRRRLPEDPVVTKLASRFMPL